MNFGYTEDCIGAVEDCIVEVELSDMDIYEDGPKLYRPRSDSGFSVESLINVGVDFAKGEHD
eukprot:Pgem_evm1s18383